MVPIWSTSVSWISLATAFSRAGVILFAAYGRGYRGRVCHGGGLAHDRSLPRRTPNQRVAGLLLAAGLCESSNRSPKPLTSLRSILVNVRPQSRPQARNACFAALRTPGCAPGPERRTL